MKQEIVSQLGHAAPSVSVLVAAFLAVPVNTWLAGGYIILQAAYLIWKWYKEYKKDKV